MSNMIDLGSCYRTGEVARQLGVSPQRVRRLVEEGRIEAELTPFGYLFKPENVARFRRERRQPGRPAKNQSKANREAVDHANR